MHYTILKIMCIFMDLQREIKLHEKGQFIQIIGEALQKVAETRMFAKERELLNTKEYLDFEDELNSISVADPNN